MTAPKIDLSNTLEWNTIAKVALQSTAPEGYGITPYTFATDAYEVVIGIRVADRPNWVRGGVLLQQVDQKPTSTAQLFDSLILTRRFYLTCTQYQAIRLDPDLPLPNVCTIRFPWYFRACQLEIYARNDIG